MANSTNGACRRCRETSESAVRWGVETLGGGRSGCAAGRVGELGEVGSPLAVEGLHAIVWSQRVSKHVRSQRARDAVAHLYLLFWYNKNNRFDVSYGRLVNAAFCHRYRRRAFCIATTTVVYAWHKQDKRQYVQREGVNIMYHTGNETKKNPRVTLPCPGGVIVMVCAVNSSSKYRVSVSEVTWGLNGGTSC